MIKSECKEAIWTISLLWLIEVEICSLTEKNLKLKTQMWFAYWLMKGCRWCVLTDSDGMTGTVI
jgi:hypothetical protein